MKSCKSCGKWSFVLNKDGLCKNCSAKIEKQKTDIKNLEEVHSELLKKNLKQTTMFRPPLLYTRITGYCPIVR